MKKIDKIVRPNRTNTLKDFLKRNGLRVYWLSGRGYDIFTLESGWLWNHRPPKMVAHIDLQEVTVHDLDYYDRLVDVFGAWGKYWGEEITLKKRIARRPAEGPAEVLGGWGDNKDSTWLLSKTFAKLAETWRASSRCEYCGRVFEEERTSCISCGAPR